MTFRLPYALDRARTAVAGLLEDELADDKRSTVTWRDNVADYSGYGAKARLELEHEGPNSTLGSIAVKLPLLLKPLQGRVRSEITGMVERLDGEVLPA